ncbi:ARM repeat-containing protein [Rhizodiscina lignyota]|uniref:ARM repeat-containing protein n=1 Tax=Rhizodiscina lignyota TaxID=1504668 RepID=A0A9P4M1G8_9PEZI|nr:ARM repeat-containing protein [Rhizodiscina lignyota]
MEQQVIHLLSETQSSAEGPRKNAELQLQALYTEPSFPISLVSVASHESVPVNIRQASLLYLRTFIQAAWTPQFDEFKGQVLVSDENKRQLRHILLELATSDIEEQKIKRAASYVVSKIANADFPEEWPELFPAVLHVIQTGSDAQLHGALKVLGELVDDCFNDEQFFAVARELIKSIFDIAANDSRKATLRALAVHVFRGCFDILEQVMEVHKAAVKAFTDEALSHWVPFFLNILKTRLPEPPPETEDGKEDDATVYYRGMTALKNQVVKVLMRIRSVLPSSLAPQSTVLFSAIWDELTAVRGAYHQMFIVEQRQGRLEDADNLPYSLDFLVLEELDFMQAILRAPPVRKELEQQLRGKNAGETSWVIEVMRMSVAYAQITTEEEGLWNIDVNIFISEETSVTANYTPRSACGELVIKLAEWIPQVTVDGLLAYAASLYSTEQNWKLKEAALYLLNQLLIDFRDLDRNFSPEAALSFTEFIRHAMQQEEEFLRARGFLVAGSLTRAAVDAMRSTAPSFVESTLQAINNDSSEVVQVSCIRAMQYYSQALTPDVMLPMQNAIISALSNYLAAQDLQELTESEDLMTTLVETLRDAILLDTTICLQGTGLDMLFTLARHGANNFNLISLVDETFEEVVGTLSATGADAYMQLCRHVLPSLTGAFDVGTLTEENALTNLAAELLDILATHGSEPLPQGFVATVMPKLQRQLLYSTDEELLKSCTSCVKNILMHDYQQLFEWHEPESGKAGLEIVLVIIDRLLGPTVDDNAAAEVGGLAAEVVEKAGSERLGPFLLQLLKAVAVRLASATSAQFIQSLILVFARLSLHNAGEVVEFLSQVQVDAENGLQVVMSKWLENSVNFAGYDEIRQNVIALSKLYDLHDPRLAQVMVKGDLIINPSLTGRIMTRSRAREHPDQYTTVPAPIKVIKVLVEELLSASGSARRIGNNSAGSAGGVEDGTGSVDEGSDEGDWEDEPNPIVDLGLGMSKAELMAFAEDMPQRQRDDETQAYLIQFFREQAAKPGFEDVFQSLSAAEQEKIRSLLARG